MTPRETTLAGLHRNLVDDGHTIGRRRMMRFHYMQAIWTLEHKDARYLRLYDMEIQWPGQSGAVVQSSQSAINTSAWDAPNNDPGPGAHAKVDPPEFAETRLLHQIADLGRPLGFRGNLAIFPLHVPNALTTYMVQDFLDSHFGIVDPDISGNAPMPTEAMELARCLWAEEGLSQEERAEISDWLVGVYDAAEASSHEIVTPTGELFIEALPGIHSLLEDFKLQHRATDVEMARVQRLTAEIEAIRRLIRLPASFPLNQRGGSVCLNRFRAFSKSVFEKVDSHGIGVVIHGVSESTTRDECRCPDANAALIRAT